MSTYADRLTSFTAWPHASPTPTNLAEAGWSFEPESEYPDEVACEECDRCLYNSKPGCDLKMLYIGHSRSCRRYLKLAVVQNSVASPPKDSQGSAQKAPQKAPPQLAPKPSPKKPSPKDIGFFDSSLQQDFPELCLFHNVDIFCDRIKLCRPEFGETNILELLPKCLRGEALTWFRSQSGYQDLATCIRGLKARFSSQPASQPASSQTAPPASSQSLCQPTEYHHCKLCNASFSSLTRLMRHAQENICNKPRCRHCEMVFPSKNQLHQHLRKGCQKQVHTRQRASTSASSPASSPRSSLACSPAPSPPRIPPPAALPEENRVSPPTSSSSSPSPPPTYRAISPPPPTYKTYLTIDDLYARYTPRDLKMDDLFRMFGGPPATTKSSTTITIAIDDPFVRPFVFKKSLGSTQKWELGMATSHHQICGRKVFLPTVDDHRCSALATGKLCQFWPSQATERHHFAIRYRYVPKLAMFSTWSTFSTFRF